jgi:uncharacterized protein YfbU (UPF0304 family)
VIKSPELRQCGTSASFRGLFFHEDESRYGLRYVRFIVQIDGAYDRRKSLKKDVRDFNMPDVFEYEPKLR